LERLIYFFEAFSSLLLGVLWYAIWGFMLRMLPFNQAFVGSCSYHTLLFFFRLVYHIDVPMSVASF